MDMIYFIGRNGLIKLVTIVDASLVIV